MIDLPLAGKIAEVGAAHVDMGDGAPRIIVYGSPCTSDMVRVGVRDMAESVQGARATKSHTIHHLDPDPKRFVPYVSISGGLMHWADEVAEAREIAD